MIKISLKLLFAMTLFVLSFSPASFADQRNSIIEAYITGSDSQPSLLDSLFDADVQLINHYLFWERTNGSPSSINIELLQNYFNYYDLKARQAYCDSPWTPGDIVEKTRDSVTNQFMSSMHRMFEYRVFYPDLQVERNLRREMGIYQLCKFAKLSYLSLPFDPAGVGGLNRNFEFEDAFEVVDEYCKPITKKILEDEFSSDLSILSMPEDINSSRICNNPPE